ncbi:MAG TPA: glycosyltransferase family 87 protein [Chloroflexia bacterium]|nr:glycosyltransferase family 87 protein [Chloroflexia bacterium]
MEPAGGDSRVAQRTSVEQGRRYALLALILFAAIFTIGAQSWVRFFLDPKVANGIPEHLFTQADFPAIAIGSRIVANGRGAQLYDLDAQLEEQRSLIAGGYIRLSTSESLQYPYPYTPFIAVLWSPLSGLSPLVGKAIWDLLNIAMLAGGLWYLLLSLPLPRITQLLLLLAAITSFPFIVNLEQGQSSGVVMLGFAGGIALLRRERDLPAGLLFGLLALKVQWLPLLVLVLLFKRRWWALAGLAATVSALSLLAIAVMGTSWIPDYLRVLEGAQRWDRALLLDPQASHSLSGGVIALFGRGSEGALRIISLAATLLSAGFLLYVWRGAWRPGTARWDALMAITLLATMFTNLQLNTHDLCLLALPAALGISYLYQSPKGEGVKVAWYALLWGSYIVPALLLPQTFASPIRITTWLVAGMLGLLSWLLLSRSAHRDNAATTAQ